MYWTHLGSRLSGLSLGLGLGFNIVLPWPRLRHAVLNTSLVSWYVCVCVCGGGMYLIVQQRVGGWVCYSCARRWRTTRTTESGAGDARGSGSVGSVHQLLLLRQSI